MGDWALSTNLYTFAQLSQGFFAWPVSGAEAELIRSMRAGDHIVPKFARRGGYRQEAEAGDAQQREYCKSIGVDYDHVLSEYDKTIKSGDAAVPFVLRIVAPREDDARPKGPPWAGVEVEQLPLAHPLSNKEFLRARVVPPQVAAQFKASVSPGRHVQSLPGGAGTAISALGASADRGDALRRYSLVRAGSVEEALEHLTISRGAPLQGDRAFAAAPGGLLGVLESQQDGALKLVSKSIPRSPQDLRLLFEEAKGKATEADHFAPQNPLAAADEITVLLDGVVEVLAVDDFARFHDRYEILSAKVTQADEIARRTTLAGSQGAPAEATEEEPEPPEVDEELALAGLTIEAVRAELPAGMVLPDPVIAEAVTALRAGKHLLLGGPPGTGKSTLAEALARAVMGNGYDVTTATADWTTFDTIGGYLPDAEGGIRFVPGVVLRVLKAGRWLIIDELNRADIDKAFGPLFTLLSGGDSQAARRAALPYQDAVGQPVSITWAATRSLADAYVITPSWRILGTLNLADKASLFQLSFAFLRRFAVVDVPLPPQADYARLLGDLLAEVPDDVRPLLVRAAEAAATGPRQIGPAIMADVAKFVSKGTTAVGGGAGTYADPVHAFLVAVRLMVVPQYEGAELAAGRKLLSALGAIVQERPAGPWEELDAALRSVSLR